MHLSYDLLSTSSVNNFLSGAKKTRKR